MDAPRQSASQLRSRRMVAWGGLPFALGALVVQITGTGIDILLIAAVCFVLFIFERTVGDWLGELVGSRPAVLIITVWAATLLWFLFANEHGRSQTERFLAAAEERGYQTAWLERSPPPPVPDGGAGSSEGGTTQGAASAPSAASADLPASREQSPSGGRKDQTEPAGGDETATTATGSAPAPAGSGGRSSISRSLGRLFGRDRGPDRLTATSVVVTLSPAQVQAARGTTIRAVVTAGARPVVEGAVEFIVNERGAGLVPVDRDGTAATTFSTHISGTYHVLARFSGTSEYAASVSSVRVLTVSSSR